MGYVLVTGGSRGIGFHVADMFASSGQDVVLVARDKDALRDAKRSLREHDVTVHTLSQDLSDPGSAEDLIEFCDREDWSIDVVVNNAGFGKQEDYTDTGLETNKSMLLLNCYTPMVLAHEYVQRGASVINIGSVAGYQPLPGFANYAATKAYIYSWSVALNQEVEATVLTVCPGATKTGFGERAGAEGIDERGMDPRIVAEQIIDAYNDDEAVLINRWKNKVIVAAASIIPPSWISFLIGSQR